MRLFGRTSHNDSKIFWSADAYLQRPTDARGIAAGPYWTSRVNGRRFEPFGDYSSQTYLLVPKASGVDALRHHPVLRYIEVAVGYRARGYSDVGGRLVEIGRRSLYAGVSLSLSELLGQTVFRQSHCPAQAVADTVLEYVQVPGTAVLGRIGLDD